MKRILVSLFFTLMIVALSGCGGSGSGGADSSGSAAVTGQSAVTTDNDGARAIAQPPTFPTDAAAVAADKLDLDGDDIRNLNPDLAHITVNLTNPLPSQGVNDSTITWASSNPAIISDDGQTINRPPFADGNTAVLMTATIQKNDVIDTKVFELTVLKLPASSITAITSNVYTISENRTSREVITNVPVGTSKSVFLANLIKGEPHQFFADSGLDDIIIKGNTLVVIADLPGQT